MLEKGSREMKERIKKRRREGVRLRVLTIDAGEVDSIYTRAGLLGPESGTRRAASRAEERRDTGLGVLLNPAGAAPHSLLLLILSYRNKLLL